MSFREFIFTNTTGLLATITKTVICQQNVVATATIFQDFLFVSSNATSLFYSYTVEYKLKILDCIILQVKN